MKTRTSKTLMNSRLNTFVVATICAVAIAFPIALPGLDSASQRPKHHRYRVIVMGTDGGVNSYLAGYLVFAPLTDRGTLGVATDTSIPGVYNSYTWTNGKQVDFQPLPQLSNLTGTNTYINWINQLGLAAGYGTRTNSITGASVDNAAVWTPNGQIFELSTPPGDQSHAVWINDFGQVSGWIANSTTDPCNFGILPGEFQTQGVVWEYGVMVPLGTLGGTSSYGEFINDRGQVSGHSETSNEANPNTGCPTSDPFIWEKAR